ncbi:MAG: hypothetical protein MUF45_00740 [Spirosomaceae bacterium]|jgi:hypothetical protein|nr:hypothetical protein [Spirosomataceae bacterium]
MKYDFKADFCQSKSKPQMVLSLNLQIINPKIRQELPHFYKTNRKKISDCKNGVAIIEDFSKGIDSQNVFASLSPMMVSKAYSEL